MEAFEEKMLSTIQFSVVKKEVEELWKKKAIDEICKAMQEVRDRAAWNEQYSRKSSIRIHRKSESDSENVDDITVKTIKRH